MERNAAVTGWPPEPPKLQGQAKEHLSLTSFPPLCCLLPCRGPCSEGGWCFAISYSSHPQFRRNSPLVSAVFCINNLVDPAWTQSTSQAWATTKEVLGEGVMYPVLWQETYPSMPALLTEQTKRSLLSLPLCLVVKNPVQPPSPVCLLI